MDKKYYVLEEKLRKYAKSKGVHLRGMYFSGDVELKYEFVKDLIKNKYSINGIYAICNTLSKASKWEDLFGKDVAEFDKNEYLIFLKDRIIRSERHLTSVKSLIDKYLKYVVRNSKRNIKLPYSLGVKRNDLLHVISKVAATNRYITKDEYEYILNSDGNYQDKAIIILLWNGLYNTNLEYLRNVKILDIDYSTKTIYYNEKKNKVALSDEEFSILISATEQTEYKYTYSEYIGNNVMLFKGPYLLRACSSKISPLSYTIITKRIKGFLNSINIKTDLRGIYVSGLYNKYKNSEDCISKINSHGIKDASVEELMISMKSKENL